MPDQQYEALRRLASQHPHIEVQRFTPTFQALMQQAVLSISMAGYNTCMNVLKTGTRALVLPFTGHKNDEQTIRAKKLETTWAAHRLGAGRPDSRSAGCKDRGVFDDAPPWPAFHQYRRRDTYGGYH